MMLLVLFSESVLHSSLSLADGLTLERISTGETVVGHIAVAGTAVAFVAGSELAPGETYRFRAGLEITDLVGHPLQAGAEVTFETASSVLATAPTLDPLADVVCGNEITVTGNSTPHSRVKVRDGDLVFSGIADAAGAFAVTIFLTNNGYHLLHVYNVDYAGNAGAERTHLLRVDCSAPSVTSAVLDRATGTITISLSEAIDPGTATIGSPSAALRLFNNDDPSATDRTGTVTVSPDGTEIAILLDPAPGSWWHDTTVRLLVAPPLADLQGNLLASAHDTVFFPSGQGGLAGSFLFGEAYDDASGRPLDGATANLYSSASALPGAVPAGSEGTPVATDTTDSRGRFTMAGDVAAGRYVLVIEREGYSRVVRRLALAPATGAVPFDARLTPLAEAAGTLNPVTGGKFHNLLGNLV
ncbi:MAG: hypothetical protein GY836_18225, partial [Herbaspirillum sp.]|nr:hypothetical protein [Herbaspirillum sp.]